LEDFLYYWQVRCDKTDVVRRFFFATLRNPLNADAVEYSWFIRNGFLSKDPVNAPEEAVTVLWLETFCVLKPTADRTFTIRQQRPSSTVEQGSDYRKSTSSNLEFKPDRSYQSLRKPTRLKGYETR